MRIFVCLLDPEGRGIPESVRTACESVPRHKGLPCRWLPLDHGLLLTASDQTDRPPLVSTYGCSVGIGMVRLDNRAELVHWTGTQQERLTDLDLVLRTVATRGPTSTQHFLGEFAFVIWNHATHVVLAACDALLVRRLYYSESKGILAFASRGELLASDGRYNVQYLAERVSGVSSESLSPYEGVRCLPAGTQAVFHGSSMRENRFWTAYNFEPEPRWGAEKRETVRHCRDLLVQAVKLRLDDPGRTWAQLSGGLDSSSVVSIAQWLAGHDAGVPGLMGTVTYSDSYGTGADEREYSEVVAEKWSVRNETIHDPPLWYDEKYPPACTDEPTDALMFYPRDRRVCEVVRSAGGRSLLTGVGGDVLFAGNMFFFADWLSRGQFLPAVTEMVRRAGIGRASFWELAYRNALLPLLPRALQQRLVEDIGRVPSWVRPDIAAKFELRRRSFATLSYAGRFGRKYQDAVAVGVTALATNMPVRVIEDELDVQHPFLYRPLVEFALRLPPELCVQPYARKWILREAMRGFLPESVRLRIGKGTSYGQLAWSVATQRNLLQPLMRAPMLADLGIIDPALLRTSFERAGTAPAGRDKLSAVVQHTLAIEAWLQMRSGQWPCRGHHGVLT